MGQERGADFPPRRKEEIEDATQNRKLVHCDAGERQASAATKREGLGSTASPKHDQKGLVCSRRPQRGGFGFQTDTKEARRLWEESEDLKRTNLITLVRKDDASASWRNLLRSEDKEAKREKRLSGSAVFTPKTSRSQAQKVERAATLYFPEWDNDRCT